MKKVPEEMKARFQEGLSNLRERADFNVLVHYGRVWEIEAAVEKFGGAQEPEAIRHALSIFHETSGPAIEGSNAYDNTIWDANIQVLGKMTTLDDLFTELEAEYRKDQSN